MTNLLDALKAATAGVQSEQSTQTKTITKTEAKPKLKTTTKAQATETKTQAKTDTPKTKGGAKYVIPKEFKQAIEDHLKGRADMAENVKPVQKVWVVKQESNVDGEYMFDVIVCKDAGTAIRTMKQEIDTLLDESPKYKDARRWIEGTDKTLDYDDCPYSWENESYDRFFINVVNDDYHELLTIEEMEIKND